MGKWSEYELCSFCKAQDRVTSRINARTMSCKLITPINDAQVKLCGPTLRRTEIAAVSPKNAPVERMNATLSRSAPSRTEYREEK